MSAQEDPIAVDALVGVLRDEQVVRPSATRARRLREERTDHVPIYSERHALAVVNEHSDHFNNQRLTLNYRTTVQNLRYALAVLDGGDLVDLEKQAEATGCRSARSGPIPAVGNVESLVAELDTIADRIRSWLDGGVNPEMIAVLVHDEFQRERVVNALNERGVRARAVDRDRPAEGRVLVVTLHRAKNMEFANVVLADVDSNQLSKRPGSAAWMTSSGTTPSCLPGHWFT